MRSILLITVILIGSAFAYWHFVASDEAQIRGMFASAASLMQRSSNEHPLESLRRAKDISEFVGDQINVRAEMEETNYSGTHSRQEVKDGILALRKQLNALKIYFNLLLLKIEGKSASADVEVKALGSMPDTEGQFLEKHEAHLVLEKTSGRWLVTEVQSRQLPNKENVADDTSS